MADERPRVKLATYWQNGMVMVFGYDGEQIPELQGRYEDMRAKVLAAADDQTRFAVGVWRELLEDVARADW